MILSKWEDTPLNKAIASFSLEISSLIEYAHLTSSRLYKTVV